MSHTIGQVKQKQQQSNSNSTEVIPDPPESSDPSFLTDDDYEFLFNQLLQGIAHGWHQKRVVKFFTQLGDRGKQADWVDWLGRFGSQILTRHIASREQLGMLMIRLGEISRTEPSISKIGAVSYQIGRKLAARDSAEDAVRPKPQSVVWEYDGSDSVANLPVENTENISPVASETEEAASHPEEVVTAESLETQPTTLPQTEDAGISEVAASHPEEVVTAESLETQPTTLPNAEDAGISEVATSYPEEPITAESPESETVSDEAIESEISTQQDLNRVTSSQLLSLIEQDEELAQQISQKLNISLTPQPQQNFPTIPEIETIPSDVADETTLELVESWFNLGLKQVSAGEFEGAINSWEQALKLNPNLAEAWHNRGSALGRLSQYQLAVDSFERALSIDPDNERAWNDRAHALYQLQRWTEAVASWNRAIDLTPGNHLFWYNRGCALEQLKNFDESIASYEKAIEIKPDFQPARSRYINLVADNSHTN